MADFNYYINRQGIQGRKGEKGDKGFSPTINVSTDTVDEYKLTIANEDNTFETPNLRGNIKVLDNGGTYLRYDKETQQILAQDMDAATANTLGGVRLSTEENITAMGTNTVVTPADVADALPIYLQGEGAVSITQDEETSKTKINVDLSSMNELTTRVSNAEAEIVGIQADVADLDADVSTLNDITISHTTSISAINDNIANLNANKVAKTDLATTESAGIVKVDGTSITVDQNGVISSVGGGGTGDVTSNRDNTFTGNNTFSKTILATGSDALLVDNQTSSWTSSQGVEFTKGNDGISHERNYNFMVADGSGSEYQAPVENVTLAASGDLILKANNNNISSNALLTSIPTIKDGDGNIILSQGNVIAGDNVTIENTIKGIKISSSGGSTPTNMVTTDTKQTITGKKSVYGGTLFYYRTGKHEPYVNIGEGNISEHNGICFYSPNATTHYICGIGNTFSKLHIGDGFQRVNFVTSIYDKHGVEILGGGSGAAIDDTTVSTTTTYSSSKIEGLIGDISTILDSINGEVI